VYRFEELWREGDRRGFLIECSSGTYVRSLIAALGDAYCEQLRRVAIGTVDVADADPERVIPLEQALDFLPEVRLSGVQARRARHGTAIDGQASGPVRLTDASGLVGVAEPTENGQLAPRLVLR
jgi:tRNA pseudouridine55 synthase